MREKYAPIIYMFGCFQKTEKVAKDVDLAKVVMEEKIDALQSDVQKIVQLQQFTPRTKKLLSKLEKKQVKSLRIRRHKISSYIGVILNILSLGQFERNKKKLGLDKLYHIRTEILTTEDEWIVLEKTQSVGITYFGKKISIPSKSEKVDIFPIPDGLLFGPLVELTKEWLGDEKFFLYSAENNNCQDFALALLKANHLITDENAELIAFIKQDTKDLFNKIDNVEKITHTITDVAAETVMIDQQV